MVHLAALTAGGALDDIGRSLREAFFMFWETLWALVLGFGLSGAVQAFVSREEMRARLGDHSPLAVARAAGYGMISSSCSYAASAMAKSLFQKGADFISALVFMFASTNLVVELGIVLLILMGWQFTAAEFVGGPIMIVLLAAVGGLVLNQRVAAAARRRLMSGSASTAHEHHGDDESLQRLPWGQRIRSVGGWADAATYTMADLTMLRREMVIGYAVAGFLAVLVPTHLWHAVFTSGHGWATSLENVVVGPFIAVISFVCSVGNVPMAAALWKGGISFGGVVSFLFADLIALPLLLIYRKYYGAVVTGRILAVFWAVMSLAGLATEAIFRSSGLVPAGRPSQIVPERFSWNYTTFLNLAFLAVFGGLYWIYRNRERLGGGAGYAIDPVCGMQVETVHAPAVSVHEGRTVYFCSDHCRHRFDADPARFAERLQATRPGGAAASAHSGHAGHTGHGEDGEPGGHCQHGHDDGHTEHGDRGEGHGESGTEREQAVDPVCGMTVDTSNPGATAVHAGRQFYFCCPGCRDRFVADPQLFTPTGA